MAYLLVLIPIGIAAWALVSSRNARAAVPGTSTAISTDGNPWGLPDIDASEQQGGFTRAFDESFERAAAQTGVPFALIKAHAIRESKLKPGAYHYDNSKSGASYGLMQVEWNNNNRFDKYGYPDDLIGRDGSLLYTPDLNAYLGACIIRDNLAWLKGSLRDAINAYNTGKAESLDPAPGNYVDDVLNYYSKLIGGPIT